MSFDFVNTNPPVANSAELSLAEPRVAIESNETHASVHRSLFVIGSSTK